MTNNKLSSEFIESLAERVDHADCYGGKTWFDCHEGAVIVESLRELQEYRKATGEPVAWILTGIDGRKYTERDKTVVEMFSFFVGNKVEPLYTTPQPAPAVEAVPDEAIVAHVCPKCRGIINSSCNCGHAGGCKL